MKTIPILGDCLFSMSELLYVDFAQVSSVLSVNSWYIKTPERTGNSTILQGTPPSNTTVTAWISWAHLYRKWILKRVIMLWTKQYQKYSLHQQVIF